VRRTAPRLPGTPSTARVHAHIRAAQARVAGGGLFCLRVNATGTDIWPEHGVTERHLDGGLTVRYLAGPKRHLLIHFFSAAELGALFGSGSSQSCSSDRNTPGALRPSPAGGPSGKPSGGG
jgi:hypothetical protein